MSKHKIHLLQHRSGSTYCGQYRGRVKRISLVRKGKAYPVWDMGAEIPIMYEDVCKRCGEQYTEHTGIPYISLTTEEKS